jgi:hypothetical protein
MILLRRRRRFDGRGRGEGEEGGAAAAAGEVGQGPGGISSPLTGESFSAKAISASVAVPPERPGPLWARNTLRRARRSSILGKRGGIFPGDDDNGWER